MAICDFRDLLFLIIHIACSQVNNDLMLHVQSVMPWGMSYTHTSIGQMTGLYNVM